MSDVVVIALTAEWFTATLHSTIIADQKSAIGALGHSAIATWRYICPIARRVFDLTEWIHSCNRQANHLTSNAGLPEPSLPKPSLPKPSFPCSRLACIRSREPSTDRS